MLKGLKLQNDRLLICFTRNYEDQRKLCDYLKRVFKGFLYRALNSCLEKYVHQEIQVLMNVCTKNQYSHKELQTSQKNMLSPLLM